MRESELCRFFSGAASASDLALNVRDAVVRTSDLISVVEITDMREVFALSRNHLLKLCDAFHHNLLSPEALSTIAFALQASDTFEWEDDIISEVLSDWSSPETNFELNSQTLNMHRAWLLGSIEPPLRDPNPAASSCLISVKLKQKI